jgi:hypothetical protein
MASETTQAAILILRAKALESYGILKDLYTKQAAMGDSDKIATQALALAQYEGAMITLQQYFNNANQPPPDEPDVGADPEEEQDIEPSPRVIGPEDSATMKRTMQVHESTKAAKRQDES